MEINSKREKFEEFTSLVFPCDSKSSINSLNNYLLQHEQIFEDAFLDLEIIILIPIALEKFLLDNLEIKNKLKNNSFIITVSYWESWDSSVLTCLARANGDIVYILDPFYPDLFKKIVSINKDFLADSDIYLFKNKYAKLNLFYKFFYYCLYSFIRSISNLPLSHLDRREMILSRRSINYILKNGKKNILISEIVYRSSYPYKKLMIENKNNHKVLNNTFLKERRVQWSMLMRLSNLSSKISSLSILILIIFLAIATTNALLVRFMGFDILMNKQVVVPGWTYLVLLVGLTSLSLSFSMYSLQQSINVIHDELNKKDFEVNSYKRF